MRCQSPRSRRFRRRSWGRARIALQNINFSFLVDDCSASEARAQAAALIDARARAERAAHSAGVHLGAVLGINEASGFGSPGSGSCATKPDTATVSQQRIDGDSNSGDVFVTVSANVTFTIVP